MNNKTVFLLLLSLFMVTAECYRILLVFPVPGKSHYFLGNSLAKGLAEAGHDVTMIATYQDKIPPKNGSYREIYLSKFAEEIEKKPINKFGKSSHPFLAQVFHYIIGRRMSSETLGHPDVQKLLKSDEKFDVVIAEQFLTDALKIFAHHFNAPLISFSCVGVNRWVNSLVGNPAPPSYISDVMLGYADTMTFWQRLKNTLFLAISNHITDPISTWGQNSVLKEYFPDSPHVAELNKNVSLVLVNSHLSTSQTTPTVPNMIHIGGFHIKPPKKLPSDLQTYLDEATDGVIYLSMGSNLQSRLMPKEKIDTILKVFGKLKQKVLWKWENEELPGKPNNVKISKWFPQQSILAHPNVKLFITHGGLLSTTETTYFGVPVLPIPIFGDQHMNAAQMVLNGIGLSLDFEDLSDENKIYNTIKELLTNPKYAENAKRRSRIMHDQPMKPIDSAIFWIEYVIRHNGAPHLRVAGADLPLYQYLLLDVFAFIILVPTTIIYIIYVLYRKFKCTKNKTEKIKKN